MNQWLIPQRGRLQTPYEVYTQYSLQQLLSHPEGMILKQFAPPQSKHFGAGCVGLQ